MAVGPIRLQADRAAEEQRKRKAWEDRVGITARAAERKAIAERDAKWDKNEAEGIAMALAALKK